MRRNRSGWHVRKRECNWKRGRRGREWRVKARRDGRADSSWRTNFYTSARWWKWRNRRWCEPGGYLTVQGSAEKYRDKDEVNESKIVRTPQEYDCECESHVSIWFVFLASSSKCDKSLANVLRLPQMLNDHSCWEAKSDPDFGSVSLSQHRENFWLRRRIFTNTLKCRMSFFKENVQLRKDYLRPRWAWTEEVEKRRISDVALNETVNNLNHKDWSCVKQISGLSKLKKKKRKC